MIVSPSCAALIAACKLSFGPTLIMRWPPSQRSVNVPRDCLSANTAPIVPRIKTVASNKGRDTDLRITITSSSQSHKEHKKHRESGKAFCANCDFAVYKRLLFRNTNSLQPRPTRPHFNLVSRKPRARQKSKTSSGVETSYG